MKKLIIGIGLIIAASGFAFTTMGGMSWLDSMGLRGEDRLVRSRMVGYWDARVAADVESMADFIHPAQPMVFQSGMLITENYELQELEVEGDHAVATVKLTSRIKHALFSSKSRDVTIQDGWVRYKGTWYKEPGPVTFKDAIDHYRGTWVPPVEEENVENE